MREDGGKEEMRKEVERKRETVGKGRKEERQRRERGRRKEGCKG